MYNIQTLLLQLPGADTYFIFNTIHNSEYFVFNELLS